MVTTTVSPSEKQKAVSVKLNKYLLRSSLVGALGGLLFGFDTAVIAGTTRSISTLFRLTPAQLGFTVSIALWGTVLGALCSGIVGERLGARRALRIMALLYIVSSLGSALAWNWDAFLVFRFIGGVGVGGSSVLGPVYIAELAPARLRGRLVGLFQFNVVLGILAAYLSNYIISSLNLGSHEWRWEFGVATAPALLFAAFLFTVPSSSRWLVTQNRLEEARKVLALLGSESAEQELREIARAVQSSRHERHESVFQFAYIRPLLLALFLGAFNQLSGINAILYYLNDIFADAGFSSMSGNVQAVVIGLTNLIATMLAVSLIDKVGRRTLLLVGSVGTSIALAGVAALFYFRTASYLLLLCLIGFIFFFAISQGSVVWVYISEIFPTRVRSKGQGVGSSAHWIMNAVIAAAFPIIAVRSRSMPFLFFAVMMIVQFFVVLLFFPETRGRSLEQIQAHLGIS